MPVNMHRLQNFVFLIALVPVSILALAFAPNPRVCAAAELEWNNTDNTFQWTTTGSNWWLGSATATVPFSQGSAVVFGADDAPNAAMAGPNTISITATGGVIIGASGDNPGMIVTGTGNWSFTFTATGSGTDATNIGITDGSAGGGSGASAGVRMEGTGTLAFATLTGYTGDTDVTAGTLRLDVADAIAQSRSVNLASAATLDLGGNNQALLALSLAPGAQVAFNSTGTSYAKLTLGNLAGDGGVFAMRTDVAAGNGDQIVITGSGAGAHTLVFDNSGTATPQANSALLVVSVSSTQNSAAIFSGSTEAGIYTYNVGQGQNGSWYLTEGTPMSRAAAAIVSSAAVAGQEWHYQLDSLYKRMGDLREPPYGGDGAAGARGGAGNLWARGNFSRLNVDSSLTGRGFHEYNYGMTLGADKALGGGGAGASMLWFAGAFGDWQRATRSFDNDSDGSTTTLGGGLYLAWMHAAGWYADLIGRVDRNKNKFSAVASDGYVTSASYNNNVQGASLEFGRQIHWPQDWWIEPAVQCAIAGIGSADYSATAAGQSPIDVHVGSALASQTRLQLRFGEDGGDNPGWHPCATLAAVYSSTSDGRVHILNVDGVRPLAANYDGWRWEVGFGAAYVINSRSQFYYNYEYAHATRYSRPWSLSAGYRLMW
jgi:outer membrane autotransporter protein